LNTNLSYRIWLFLVRPIIRNSRQNSHDWVQFPSKLSRLSQYRTGPDSYPVVNYDLYRSVDGGLRLFPSCTIILFNPHLRDWVRVRDRVRVPSLARWTVVHKNIAYSRENLRCLSRALDRLWSDFNLNNQIQALKPPNDHDHQKHWTFSVKTLNFVMRIDNILLRPYWMSPPFTNLSSRFVKHGLSPRFPSPVQSSPVQSSPVRAYNLSCIV
jgi:hypothetical protein